MNQVRIGAILSYVQTVLNVIITLFYTPVMIRLLGSSEYGLYNTVSSVIAVIALLNLGFSSTYIKYYSRCIVQKDKNAVYQLNGMFLCIFLIIAILAAVCGVILSNHLTLVFGEGLTDSEYFTAKRLLLLLTLNLAISLAANVFTCIITARERFVILKLIATVKIVVSPLVTLPVLLLGYGSVGMVVAMVSLSVCCDAFYMLYVLLRLKEKFFFRGFRADVLKEIISYTGLIAVHLIVDQVNWNVDKIVLARFKGTEAVALYSVGFSLYAHYQTIGLPIVSMFVPRVHKIIAGSEHNEAKLTESLTKLFTDIGRMQYLILAPIATGFLFFGKSFISHWVGIEYEEAYYVALLLIIPGTVDLIQNIGIEIQRSQNLHAFRAKSYSVMAVINIIISIMLCQQYGAIGCAIGTAISLIVVQGVLINVYYLRKCHINIIYFWKNLLRMSLGLVPSLIFGMVLCSVKKEFSVFELVASIVCYSLIYCISMYYFGCTQNERALVRSFAQRFTKKLG